MIGVLGLYVRMVLLASNVSEDCNAACTALLLLIELAHLVVATARITVSPARLLGLIHRFLEAFTAIFGFEWLTPKCHWLLHLPDALRRFGRLLGCFVLERKHRMPKRYATELQNTSRTGIRLC